MRQKSKHSHNRVWRDSQSCQRLFRAVGWRLAGVCCSRDERWRRESSRHLPQSEGRSPASARILFEAIEDVVVVASSLLCRESRQVRWGGPLTDVARLLIEYVTEKLMSHPRFLWRGEKLASKRRDLGQVSQAKRCCEPKLFASVRNHAVLAMCVVKSSLVIASALCFYICYSIGRNASTPSGAFEVALNTPQMVFVALACMLCSMFRGFLVYSLPLMLVFDQIERAYIICGRAVLS